METEPKGAADKPRKKASPRHARIDLLGMERDYRIGKMTVKEIAEKHGVVEKTVYNNVNEFGWTRDIGDVVRSATRAAMIEQAAAEIGRGDAEAMKAEVEKNVEVLTRHRTLAAGLRDLCSRLTEELVGQSGQPETLDQLLSAVMQADEHLAVKLNQAVSLPSRVGSLDKLAGALAKLVAIERQAHAIDDDKEEGGIEEYLRQLAAQG